jgi:hypothetical protein
LLAASCGSEKLCIPNKLRFSAGASAASIVKDASTDRLDDDIEFAVWLWRLLLASIARFAECEGPSSCGTVVAFLLEVRVVLASPARG